MGEPLKVGATTGAAMLKEAFLEGAAVERGSTPIEEQWAASKSKQRADAMLRRAGDPTITERFFTLFRQWANCSPEGTTPELSWKRASALMAEMRALVGDEPFDLPESQEVADGQNR
jgi:hypothetical protein